MKGKTKLFSKILKTNRMKPSTALGLGRYYNVFFLLSYLSGIEMPSVTANRFQFPDI